MNDTERSIRGGPHRVVTVSEDESIIIYTDDGPFTEVSKPMRVVRGGGGYAIDNCAALLAMCLNADMNLMTLGRALAAYKDGKLPEEEF